MGKRPKKCVDAPVTEEEFYSYEAVEALSDADAISTAEEAFMLGYLGEENECA